MTLRASQEPGAGAVGSPAGQHFGRARESRSRRRRRAGGRRILQQVPGVTAIQNPDLFQAFRKQMTGLQQGMLFILSTILIMSLLLIGLIFLMATNERRREIGVLRALGATRGTVFRSLLAEAAILALGGGLTGIVLAAFAIYLFQESYRDVDRLPVSVSSPARSAAACAGRPGSCAAGAVTIAALIWALQTSWGDLGLVMRE